MTIQLRKLSTVLAASALFACGGGGGGESHAETTPAQTETTTDSSGDDTSTTTSSPEVEAAPPAAAAPRVRVIHATNDEAAAHISVGLDASGDPFVTSIAYGTGSGYVAVAEGRHSITVHGENDAVLGLASDVLEAGHAYTVFFVTQGAADAPFALYTGDDDDTPGEDVAAIRFFHAIQGVDDVDFCLMEGRSASPLFADVAPNALGSSQNLRYVDLPTGDVTVQLRAHASEVCHGRPVGSAHFSATAGTSYTAIAIGRPSGRPRAPAQLLVCRDAPNGDGGCDAVALSGH